MGLIYERFSELLTIGMLAIALGMDAFSLGIGMGLRGAKRREILRIGTMVALFHLLMPLLGMMAGQYAGELLGGLAHDVSGGLLALLGGHMIYSAFYGGEGQAVDYRSWIGLILFALGVSIDSFSVGVSLGMGMYHPLLWLTVLAFGIVGGLMSMVGVMLGRSIGGRLGKYGEAVGGAILLGFGLVFIF